MTFTHARTASVCSAVISETRMPESVRPPLNMSSSHSAGKLSGVDGLFRELRLSAMDHSARSASFWMKPISPLLDRHYPAVAVHRVAAAQRQVHGVHQGGH